MTTQRLLTILFGLLFLGSLITTYSLYQDFAFFFAKGGDLMRVTTEFPRHPATTPCLYGTLAFIALTVWTFTLFGADDARRARHLRIMFWILLGCVLFAWTNFGREFCKFYFREPGTFPVGCSGRPITNPFLTACFAGSVLFTLSFASVWTRKKPGVLPGS